MQTALQCAWCLEPIVNGSPRIEQRDEDNEVIGLYHAKCHDMRMWYQTHHDADDGN